MQQEDSKSSPTSSEELSQWVVQGMQDKKGIDIIVINLQSLKDTFADFFVICSGSSDAQVNAISDSIEEVVRKNLSSKPWHVEGKSNNEWVLLDYVDVVAHVFQKNIREHYSLETMWGDAEIQSVTSEN